MHWIYQSNLGSEKDVEKIRLACEELGYESTGLKCIPFSDELPQIENDGPTVFYGSINWIDNIYRRGKNIAEACTKMLIHLAEQGHIKLEG